MSSKQRARYAQATILTTIVVALVLGVGLAFGTMGVILSAITLPVPLLLLWLSADVFRSDERAEETSAEDCSVAHVLDRSRTTAVESEHAILQERSA